MIQGQNFIVPFDILHTFGVRADITRDVREFEMEEAECDITAPGGEVFLLVDVATRLVAVVGTGRVLNGCLHWATCVDDDPGIQRTRKSQRVLITPVIPEVDPEAFPLLNSFFFF